MRRRPTLAPDAPEDARDRDLVRVRAVAWLVGIGAAAATVVLSVVSAHAFKGHTGGTAPAGAAATPRGTTPAPRRAPLQLPGPQAVPAVSGAAAPLQPPAEPPANAQPAPVPAPSPPVSGGS